MKGECLILHPHDQQTVNATIYNALRDYMKFQKIGMLVSILDPFTCIFISTNLWSTWQNMEILYIIRELIYKNMFIWRRYSLGKTVKLKYLRMLSRRSTSQRDKLHQLHSHLNFGSSVIWKETIPNRETFTIKLETLSFQMSVIFRSFKVSSIFFWSCFQKHSLESHPRSNLDYGFSLLEPFFCWTLIFTGPSETISVGAAEPLNSLLMDLCYLKFPEC